MEIIIIQKISSEVKVEICDVFESNLYAKYCTNIQKILMSLVQEKLTMTRLQNHTNKTRLQRFQPQELK